MGKHMFLEVEIVFSPGRNAVHVGPKIADQDDSNEGRDWLGC